MRTQFDEQLSNRDNVLKSKTDPIKKILAVPTQHVNEINNVLKSSIKNLVKTLEEQRKDIIELINDETQFEQRFYPDLIELQQSVKNIQTELENKKELHEKFAKWREQGEAIEVEYQIIG